MRTAPGVRSPAARRIRGRRFLVVDRADDGAPCMVGMATSRAWAEYQARDLPRGDVIEVDAATARRIAAEHGADIIQDEITIRELADAAQVGTRFMRRHVERETAAGRGPVAVAVRARATNRDKCPDLPPAGTVELLADALAAALGPNARVFADQPRDWQAIRAAADEIVKGGAGA